MWREAAVAATACGVATTIMLWPRPTPPPTPLAPSEVTAAEVQDLTAHYGPIIWPPREAPRASRSKPRPPACDDALAILLRDAGFRGESLRTAWAIVMRESRGVNLDQSSPWFTGAYGIFQVQESAHAGKPWYTRSAMLDPARQARLVYLHLSERGTDWRHWGIGAGGTTDTTYYGGWSAGQVYRWITQPFREWWVAYPC
jgi:hypothetical protein